MFRSRLPEIANIRFVFLFSPEGVEMATALGAQLRRLQAPQTSVLNETKRKVSLLFDHKEAASFDARTVYLIGKQHGGPSSD